MMMDMVGLSRVSRDCCSANVDAVAVFVFLREVSDPLREAFLSYIGLTSAQVFFTPL